MVALAPHLEDFLARLFGMEAELGKLVKRRRSLAPTGRAKHGHVVLFKLPGKVNAEHLVPIKEGKLEGLDGSVSYHQPS